MMETHIFVVRHVVLDRATGKALSDKRGNDGLQVLDAADQDLRLPC